MLSAPGGTVRNDPKLMLDLFSYLRHEHLIEDRPAQYSVVASDGTVNRDNAISYKLEQLATRLTEVCRGQPHRLIVSGLRTSERFPNLFWEYSTDEEALSAWLTLRLVCGSARASRGFEMEFAEVDFLADHPLMTAASLQKRLESLVGGPLDTECYSADMGEPVS